MAKDDRSELVKLDEAVRAATKVWDEQRRARWAREDADRRAMQEKARGK